VELMDKNECPNGIEMPDRIFSNQEKNRDETYSVLCGEAE